MKFLNSSLLLALSVGSLVSCSTWTHKQPAAVAPEVVVAEPADEVYGRVPAADCDKSRWKDCKQARKGDYAERYMIDYNGGLFRKINKLECQVTGGVSSFKISQHPNDVAVLYFKKGEDLYILNKDAEWRPNGQCPSAKGNFKKLMSNVQKYTVTSNVNTTIVNAAVSVEGKFVAWDNVKPVYQDTNIDEFRMNDCYNSKDKSFSSYVLFTRDRSGNVTKVKVKGDVFRKDASKVDAKSYESLNDFVKSNKVCN